MSNENETVELEEVQQEEEVFTREDYILEVAGEEIDLQASGKVQIRRVTKLGQFFKVYGREAIRDVDFVDFTEGNTVRLFEFIVTFVGVLDEDAHVLLGEIVSGKDKEWVEEHYNLQWVVDGLVLLFNTPSFRKVLDAFFGGQE